MEAWGPSLYSNDLACDIRGDYLDELKRGETNEEATLKLIKKNLCNMVDDEDEPLFWFALADTQWNYGRLLQNVKDKALLFIESDKESERWKEAGAKQYKAWNNTLIKLQKKLNSPQPAEKKISKYRLYKCKWNLGDVFAYRFSSEYSREHGFYGKYIVFRKVSEDTWWPGHIIPVIQIYKWIGKSIPDSSTIINNELLPTIELQHSKSIDLQNLNYNVKLVCESEASIPKENIKLIGNQPGDDLIPFRGHSFWTGYKPVGWETSKYNTKFEHYVIDMLLSWHKAKASN